MSNPWRFLLATLLVIAVATTYLTWSKDKNIQPAASTTPNNYEIFVPTVTPTLTIPNLPISSKIDFKEAYPHLSGNGAIISQEMLTQTEENKQYLEIIYLANLIEGYPNPASKQINQTDKAAFEVYLRSNLESSQYNYLLKRKYQDYGINHYLDNYLVKHFGLYNQQTKTSEKIQCLGWFAIVSDLIVSHYENDKLAGVNHYNVLFPNEIFRIKNTGDITIFYPETFEDLQPGDVYIYERHIGIILNIFTFEGKKYYMITEANSPKGSVEFYKPSGEPIIYLADQTKFLQAVGLRGLYILRPTNRANTTIPNSVPSSDFQNIITNMSGG